MIKFGIVNGFVLAALLLGACASQGVAPDASDLAVTAGGKPPAAQPAAPQPVTAHPSVVQPLPPVGEAIYDVLVGEIASQRGQLPLAATHYLNAARVTHNPRIAERATHMAFLAGDTPAGAEAARLWVAMEPASTEAQQSLAVFLLRSGDTAAALTELETLINTLRPHGAEGAYELVAALLAREKAQDAVSAIMDKLIERAGQYRPEALLALGRLEVQTDHPARALETLDRALQERPHLNGAILLRARVLQLQGKREDALRYLADAVREQPRVSALRLAYGRALIEAEQFEQARAQFAILAQQEPKNGDVLFSLGILYLQTNQDEQAKQQFLRLLQIGQRTQESSFFLGQIAETYHHYPEAMKWYRSVTEGNNVLDAQIRVAALLARRGDLAAARAHLHSLEPQDATQAIRLVLAEVDLLNDAGRLTESMEILERALKELPDNADLLYAHAMTAERLNQISVLEQDLTTILATDPNHVQALNALGYTLADRTKRYQEALGYIQRALALRPKDFYILDSMGWVQYRLGHYAAALRYLRQALALQNDPEVAAHLGEVLWVVGEHQEARTVWLRALAHTPSSKVLREAMDRFHVH